MSRFMDQYEVDREFPGFLEFLGVNGVRISNNAGAIIVDGYIGDILDSLRESGVEFL